MTKKYILSVLGCFFIMFAIGTILHLTRVEWVHGDVFGDVGRSAADGPNVDIVWSLFVAYVIPALLFPWIYLQGYKGKYPILEGLRFGLTLGVLIYVTYAFLLYAKFKIELIPTLIHSGMHVIEAVAGGIIIALIFGKKNAE